MDAWWWVVVAVLGIDSVLLVWLVVRRPPADEVARAEVRSASERLERELRDELGRSAQGTRQELGHTLANFQQVLSSSQSQAALLQNEQIDSFRIQLAAVHQAMNDALQATVSAQAAQAGASREAQEASLKRFSDTLSGQLRTLSEANERRIGEMKSAVEQQLGAMRQGNELKLEQMRATVDEKLNATLEQRLGESFKQVAERLEQVYRGLGEMQNLARDVGALNRVLTNVKTRGIFGEVQLAGLLEQVFTPEQYAANVETVPGSGARVEYAIRLPGRRADGVTLWLPIDAKFPREDYERLLDAHDRADGTTADSAARAIEQRLRSEARHIREKYVAPPHTTDFGILFVPTEGLYAEALRRPGLQEALQREHRVILAGPTTLLAILNSLQMGFRTLALEQRSMEVWEVLGAVKTEFAKFGDVLAKTKKKLDEASNNILQAEVRARAMSRELRSVEALPEAQAKLVLPLPAEDEPVEDPSGPRS